MRAFARRFGAPYFTLGSEKDNIPADPLSLDDPLRARPARLVTLCAGDAVEHYAKPVTTRFVGNELLCAGSKCGELVLSKTRKRPGNGIAQQLHRRVSDLVELRRP